MKLHSTSFENGGGIPPRIAFGIPDPDNHVAFSDNLNPQLSWSDLPEGTKSLVLICVDVDVPTKADDVNQEGRQVPADLPRTDFYHWVMVDMPPSVNTLVEGGCSEGVTEGGKSNPPGPEGTRHGLNDYTQWFAGDSDMEGQYFGYDGPCPPWNDSLVHHYHFRLYALDLERCPVEAVFTGADVMKAIEGHVVDQAEWVGRYSLNPEIAL